MVERRPRHLFPTRPSTFQLPETRLPNTLKLSAEDDPVFYVCNRQGYIVNGNSNYRSLLTELSGGRPDGSAGGPFPPTTSTLVSMLQRVTEDDGAIVGDEAFIIGETI